MIQLLIVADDFTGALDTGVQLAACGAPTRVLTDPHADLAQAARDVQVLVLDAETRHLTPQRAYDIVYDIAKRAAALGVPYFYKKTDSALRGNVGAELAAVLDATGAAQLPFFPAFPQMDRCTVDGVHYIGKTPVAESVFGQDPFEPVTESNVAALIAAQTETPVVSLSPLQAADPLPAQQGILAFDASTEADLAVTGQRLLEADRLHLMAGCAGFAALLPDLLHLRSDTPPAHPVLDPRLLMLCGSVNPITTAQTDVAERAGFTRLRMTPEQKLTPGYWDTPDGQRLLGIWAAVLKGKTHCIIDSNDAQGNEATAQYAAAHGLTIEDVRVRIAGTLGQVLKQLNRRVELGTLLITGGDTLLLCMEEMGVHELEPLCELASGVVLSRFVLEGRERHVISKSGGFGAPSLLCDLVQQLGSPL